MDTLYIPQSDDYDQDDMSSERTLDRESEYLNERALEFERMFE